MAAVSRSASVVQPEGLPAERTAGGATVRLVADTGAASLGTEPGLLRRLIEIPVGSCLPDAVAAAQLWYVVSGTGSLSVPGQPSQELNADQGVLIPAGTRYRLTATSPLRLDAVTLPARDSGPRSAGGGPLVRALAECPAETTGDRRFRVLFGPGRDCQVATQFVGEIPPGRAPEHSHPYDEVVLVLDGNGVGHAGGGQHALAPGTCIHLPPGVPHCLENPGPATLRVLGVFHPADSPAAKLAPPGGLAQSSAE
jgi:mannose-6-phosphate isomerase-like protein (cupin superfamily)